jgi:cytochrome P450
LLGSHDGLMPAASWQRCALIPNAVEELLRASTRGGAGIAGIPRYARSDFEIDDVAIRAGDLLLLDIGSANHDPAVFIDPDSVDVVRKQAAHLTFGYGAHYCIGASLARIELKTVFTQLIPRFPSMQLTVDPTTLRVRRDVLAGGLGELHVTARKKPSLPFSAAMSRSLQEADQLGESPSNGRPPISSAVSITRS